MPSRRSRSRTLLLLLALACAPADEDAARSDERAPATAAAVLPPQQDLVDHTIAPAIAGEEGWNYSQLTEVDLTGDGQAERVVLTARVELIRGRPAWDDGQPWQVYVESPTAPRTYLYAQRLQLGTLSLRVTRADSTRTPTIVLLEHLPDRLRVMELAYGGFAGVAIASIFERELDPRGETAAPRLP